MTTRSPFSLTSPRTSPRTALRTPARLRRLAIGALLCGVGGASLVACGSDSEGAAGDGSDSGVSQVAITLVSGAAGDECKVSTDKASAGPITFTVKNESATAITEFEVLEGNKIIGEKENLAPGLPEATITLTLGGGSYTFLCPGAVTEKIPFTVSGKAAAAPTGTAAELLRQGATEYAAYVKVQLDAMVVAVQNLQKAVESGDLSAAQEAYAQSRPFYEKVESDVDGFVMDGFEPTDNNGNLDYLVDMRASNKDDAVGWSGFHAVERDLFEAKAITARTKKYAADLTTNVTKLAALAADLEYKPEDLANGAAGLLEEVQANKITGEEEAYSHIDLVDFANNVEGAQQAFEALKPGLTEIDATLTGTIAQRFEDVTTMLDTYRDPKALGGYASYTAELRRTDGKKLSAAVQALQDTLARLAEKVATA